jgi:hypothetical protein
LEHDFSAIITPGLNLAFEDRVKLKLKGRTPSDEKLERVIPVCGPAAFVVLKSLAFRARGERKDAYDLVYVLRHHRDGIDGIVQKLRSFAAQMYVNQALEILSEDFASPEHLGPMRVALFERGNQDEEIQGQAYAFVSDLLTAFRADKQTNDRRTI